MRIDFADVGKEFSVERVEKGAKQLEILGYSLQIAFPDTDIIEISEFAEDDKKPLAIRYYSHSKKQVSLNILPRTLEHPVLVYLDKELHIGAKSACDINIIIPIAYSLKTTDKPQFTLAEFNPPPIKFTWQGAPTGGRLCYGFKSDIIMNAEDFSPPPYSILVPLKVVNERTESFLLPPIRIDDDLLFIHLLGDKIVACEVSIVVQKEGGVLVNYPDSTHYPQETMLFPRKADEPGPLTRSLFDLIGLGDEE